MTNTIVGLEFIDNSGYKQLIRLDQILFIEELTSSRVQITTEKWIKVFNVSYTTVIDAVLRYDDFYGEYIRKIVKQELKERETK